MVVVDVGVVVGVVVVAGDKGFKTDTVNNSRPTRPKVVMIRSYSREEKHL